MAAGLTVWSGFPASPLLQAVLLAVAAYGVGLALVPQLGRRRAGRLSPIAGRTRTPHLALLRGRSSPILEGVVWFSGHTCRPDGHADGGKARTPLDLAVIGNCRIAALTDRRGRILWWCFPRFDADPVFSRLLAGDEEKGFCDVVMEGRCPAEASLPAQHGDRRDHHPRRAAAMPFASPTSRRASSASSACSTRRRSSAASSRWPACRASRSGCGRPSTTAGPAASRAIGSNHIRYSGGADALRLTTDARPLLHRPRDAVRADQAGHPDPGPGRAVRGRRRYRLARIPRAHARLLARLGALARHPAGVPGRRHPRGHHAEAVQLRGDGRHHRRPHHLDSRRRRARSAPGTIATAGCGMPSSSSRRSTASAPRRRWKNTSTTSPTSPSTAERPLRPVYGIVPAEPLEERIAPDLAGFQGMGPGAGRQPGGRAAPARRLRQRDPRRLADVHRRAPAAHGRCRPVPPPRAAGRAGAPLCAGARCGPLGIPRPPARAHPFRHHVLGGVRPAGAHRRAPGACRPGRALAAARPTRCAIRS